MTVALILKSKGTSEVVTVPTGTRVAEAAALLSERRIGTVVISDNGKTALGILSERDIVREIGKRGGECLDEKVEEMMTSELITCSSGDHAGDILAKMTEGRFRHMPVIEEGEMIGLITLGDVVKYRLSELSMENNALEDMIKGY